MAGSEKVKSYMHRKEFSQELARRTGMPVEAAEEVVEAFLTILRDTWAKKRSICFDGFGIFEIRATSERMARNPRSMEEAFIPAGYKPVFKANKMLKSSVTQEIQQHDRQMTSEKSENENSSCCSGDDDDSETDI